MNSEFNYNTRYRKRKREEEESAQRVNDDIDDDNDEGHILPTTDSIGDNDEEISVSSDGMFSCVRIRGQSNAELFGKHMIQKKRPAVSMYSKDALLRVCCNAFAYHRFDSAAKLMPALVRDQRISHSFIKNAAFILFAKMSSDSNLLLKAMKIVSKYDVNKREVMLEMILHFIEINDIMAAKQYIEVNRFYIDSNGLRKNVVIDPILNCYISFVNYKEWKQSLEETKEGIVCCPHQLMAEKAKVSLRNTITAAKDLDLDYFVLILVEMYEYSQQFKEIFQILQVYTENNASNVNAYIYLYNYSVKYPGYSTPESQLNALQKIHHFSPDNPLALKWAQNSDEIIKKFQIFMDFVDYRANRNDINGWTQLTDFITSCEDINIKSVIKESYEKVYHEYWVRLHCKGVKLNQMNENTIQIIGCKQKIVAFFYGSSHQFIIETNQKIEEYTNLMD